MLGTRSGIDWILERYQVKTDKASGIVNDWSREHHQPRYIIDLIGRVTVLSVETMNIVDGLPDLGRVAKGGRATIAWPFQAQQDSWEGSVVKDWQASLMPSAMVR